MKWIDTLETHYVESHCDKVFMKQLKVILSYSVSKKPLRNC